MMCGRTLADKEKAAFAAFFQIEASTQSERFRNATIPNSPKPRSANVAGSGVRVGGCTWNELMLAVQNATPVPGVKVSTTCMVVSGAGKGFSPLAGSGDPSLLVSERTGAPPLVMSLVTL